MKKACKGVKIKLKGVLHLMKFDVILHKEDNGYWAEVPALKGCYTQGDTLEEIKTNIKDAITAWLSVDIKKMPSNYFQQIQRS